MKPSDIWEIEVMPLGLLMMLSSIEMALIIFKALSAAANNVFGLIRIARIVRQDCCSASVCSNIFEWN